MTLTLRELSYLIKGRTLVDRISLQLKPGSLYGLIGPNGSGKTTLLKTMAGVLKPSHGSLDWNGNSLLDMTRREASRLITLVPQNPHPLFDYTAYEMVEMGRYPYGFERMRDQSIIQDALHQVDGFILKDRPVTSLSGGERQRIYIARGLVTQAPVILLDEPIAHLDLKHQLEVWKVLKKLVENGKIIVVALHDLMMARNYCNSLILIHEGKCMQTGAPKDVLTPDNLENFFGVNLNILHAIEN